MKCPHCNTPLAERKVRGQPVALDYCKLCNAAWFDESELPRLLGRDPERQVEVPPNAIRMDKTLCPKCKEPMYMFGYPGTGRVIEGCGKCGGLWLDNHDLEEIKALPPEKPAAKRPAAKSKSADGRPVKGSKRKAAPPAGPSGTKKIKRPTPAVVRERVRYSEKYGLEFSRLLLQSGSMRIDQQVPPWVEQKLRLVAANSYRVRSVYGSTLGWVEEQGAGLREWIRRSVARRKRKCLLNVTGGSGEIVLSLTRSRDALTVSWRSHLLGTVEQRGASIEEGWRLLDGRGGLFGTIRYSSRPARETAADAAFDWRFPLVDRKGKGRGVITKKWSGSWKERTTDSDNFRLDFGSTPWTPEQRAVIFGAVFAIDFDLFEDDNPHDGRAG